MRKVKAKVIVAGSAACGKSALLQLYTTGEVNFLKDYQPTQIAEISSKLITFEQEEKDVEFFFFDFGGQIIYTQTIIESILLNNADLIMLCFDQTKKSSLMEIEIWYDRIKKSNGGQALNGVLIATKLDLKSIREVTEQEGIDLAKRLNLQYFQLSTARNQDIELPFQALARKLLNIK